MAKEDSKNWIVVIHYAGIWLGVLISLSAAVVGYGMLKNQVYVNTVRITKLEETTPLADGEIKKAMYSALKQQEVDNSKFRERVIDSLARIETKVSNLEKAK